MYSVRVCTTDDRELPAPQLGLGLTWDRLTDILRRDVSPEAGDLLAEPIHDAARAKTHWHITADGDAVLLSNLAEAEQRAASDSLAARRREILAFADRLEAQGGESNMRLAAALRLIIQTPDDRNHVWAADGKPFLTAWGRSSGDASPLAARIVATTPVPQVEASPALAATVVGRDQALPPDARQAILSKGRGRHGGWLAPMLWALFALIIAAIFLTLLPACAIDLPLVRGIFDKCRAAEGNLDRLREQNSALREAIRAAELEAAAKQGRCAAAIPEPTRPGAREAEQRRREARVERGKLDVTLVWNGAEDLDLHVYCPGGHIYYETPAACGGALDVDRNADRQRGESHPIEHVAFAGEPPAGDYRIEVVLYNRYDLPARNVPFTIIIRDQAGEREYPGQAQVVKAPVAVTSFRR